MSGNTLVQKLLSKAGQRIAIVNSPAGYVDQLGPLPEGSQVVNQLNNDLTKPDK